MQIPAQDFRTSIFTYTRPREEKFKLLILSGMTSWTAGPLQQLMRSSPFPWRSPIVLMKFLITGTIIQITMARTTMTAKPWQQKNDNKPWHE